MSVTVTPCTGDHVGHNIAGGTSAQAYLGVQLTSGNPLIGSNLSSVQVALGKESSGDTGTVTCYHQAGAGGTLTQSSTSFDYSEISVWANPNPLYEFEFANIDINENDFFWWTSSNTSNRCGLDYYETCPNYTGFASKKNSFSPDSAASLTGQLRSDWTTSSSPPSSSIVEPPPIAMVRY